MPKRPVRMHSVHKSCKIQPNNQVTLDRVLGFTTSSNCTLSLDEKSGSTAHAAGCVVVINSFETGRQHFIQSSSKKAITALDFSSDGKYLATGESGHHPMVRVWNTSDGAQLTEFGGHHFRVVAVHFNPTAQYLISLGSQEDHALYVWDRITGQRVASAKVTNKIHGVAFAPTGHFFVTVGVRYVRFWYLEHKRNKIRETLPLQGRNAILGEMFNNIFTDVACCCSSVTTVKARCSTDVEDNQKPTTLTLVVNASGQLLQFNEQRDLDKWVDLKTTKANCISSSGLWLTVGCANGVCLLFEADSLQFVAKLPPPHALGSDLTLSPMASSNCITNDIFYSDLIAIKFDWSRKYVVAFYNDHSIHIWDVADLSSIRLVESHYYHSRGIWSIDCWSPDQRQQQKIVTNESPNNSGNNNNGFITCSDDGTIRFWDLITDKFMNNDRVLTSVSVDGNVYASTADTCKEKLCHIIYTDTNNRYLCVSDRPSTEITYTKIEAGVGYLGGPICSPGLNSNLTPDSALTSPASPTRPAANYSLDTSQVFNSSCNSNNNNNNPTSGFRTICVSPDGKHLAAGDRDGTLRIYSLDDFKQIHQVQAHDNEILSLNFFRSEVVPQLTLLCSASRDRVIHIFDPSKDYSRVQTISDHSGAIFSAKIIETDDGEIRLISCGMDKSLLFRILEPDDTGQTAHFALEHHLVGRHSQLDAAITPSAPNVTTTNEAKPTARKRYLAVACQDRRLRIYNVVTARPVRCYRGSYTEDGFLVRCAIDPTGSVIATSGSDKQLNLLHLISGELIATLYGHSELSLGLRFLPNLNHLISVSADSCIFVWRLSPTLIQQLNERTIPQCSLSAQMRRICSEKGVRLPCYPKSNPNGHLEDEDTDDVSEFSRALCSNELTDSLLNLADESELESFACHDLLMPSKIIKDGTHLSTMPAMAVCTDTSSQPIKSAITQSKKPTFYFSVSALPAWAQRKLSRRESVAMVPASMNQIVHADTESVNSDSLSQASLDSGPICPASSSEQYSRSSNVNKAKLPTNYENAITVNDNNNPEQKAPGTQTNSTSLSRRLSQNESIVVNDLPNLSKMSKSEHHNCPEPSRTDKQATSDWVQNTLSAPDTPPNRKSEMRTSECWRSARWSSGQQQQCQTTRSAEYSRTLIQKKSRPKDLLIAGVNASDAELSSTSENNRQVNKISHTNYLAHQLHVVNECKKRHSHRSYSSNQIISAEGFAPPNECSKSNSNNNNNENKITRTYSVGPTDTLTNCASDIRNEENDKQSNTSGSPRCIRKFAVAQPSSVTSTNQVTMLESNSIKLVEESLHAVRTALDLAYNRLNKLTSYQQPDRCVEYLRQVMSGELEWRFSRLRAMLGLAPICVEAPVARVLLADFVERLLPELRSLNVSRDANINSSDNVRIQDSINSGVQLQAADVDWIVDSTTENAILRTDNEIDSQLSSPTDVTKNEDSICEEECDTMTHSDSSIVINNLNTDDNSDVHVTVKQPLETA